MYPACILHVSCMYSEGARSAKKRWHARTDELKGVRVSTLKGCCARLFQGPQDNFPKLRLSVTLECAMILERKGSHETRSVSGTVLVLYDQGSLQSAE